MSPWAPLQPCSGGCGRRVARGRCEPCRKAYRARYERGRPSRQARGLDAEYERNRALELADNERFNGGMCRYCGVQPATTADHYIPRSRGGTNDRSNLVASCGDCNGRKAGRMPPVTQGVNP